jgi:hypothetical protein
MINEERTAKYEEGSGFDGKARKKETIMKT